MAKVIPWDEMKIGKTYWQEMKGEEELGCFVLLAKPMRAQYVGLFDDWNPDGVRAEIDWSDDCRYWDDQPTAEERQAEDD